MLKLLTAILAITIVNGNGRSSRSYHKKREPVKIETHRLEDDKLTERSRLMPSAQRRAAEKAAEMAEIESAASGRQASAATTPRPDPWAEYLAGSPCPGVFGMRFGQVFDPGDAKPEIDGSYAYEPEQRFRSLTKYTVKILPRSRRVYEIAASGSGGGEPDEKEIMLKLFEQKFAKVSKYGTLYFPDKDGGPKGRTIFVMKSRVVATDLELKKELEAERQAQAAEKAAAAKSDAAAI